MDDEAYAAELLRILSNPEPTGIDPDDPYGRADDGIDRYSGFGRDVVVTGGRLVSGSYGAEVEVDFVIRPDGEPEIADRARVSADAQWRALSGYAEPSAYAPLAAREVERAAQSTWSRRRGEWQRHARAVPPRAAQWAQLIDVLAREGAVTEVAPGRLEVLVAPSEDEPGQTVTVLVTPDQWEALLRSMDPEGAGFWELFASKSRAETFLVFWKGQFEPSIREELPPVRARLPALPPGGGWYAYVPVEG
ncbi:hypothetical protein [Nocardioides jejuensis]|uniref:Uncharacterized protein n=1 Tax=Nocardioides jejuensis TaxID=2502782 RepID=A0A4R1CB25_9ACTN|nr:hypothetical protein [Nocardioides jejuensis]TCJ28079.1 hypothetical protein EPD65_08830 [Nocardioides jejuensis]